MEDTKVCQRLLVGFIGLAELREQLLTECNQNLWIGFLWLSDNSIRYLMANRIRVRFEDPNYRQWDSCDSLMCFERVWDVGEDWLSWGAFLLSLQSIINQGDSILEGPLLPKRVGEAFIIIIIYFTTTIIINIITIIIIVFIFITIIVAILFIPVIIVIIFVTILILILITIPIPIPILITIIILSISNIISLQIYMNQEGGFLVPRCLS